MGYAEVFRVDADHDREHAAPGTTSRYAEHVRAHARDVDDVRGDISPVPFACVAWRLATPPFLEPGYVRWHRRVLSASCLRNPWDGSLLAGVTVVAPRPAPLARSRAWEQDGGWRDWPEVFGQFVQPAARDLSRHPHLRTTVLIEMPVPLLDLPPVPEDPRVDAEFAQRAVQVIVRELNDQLGPIIHELES